ncbi:MAG: 50S ribosomal protein L6 [Candidatus Micrarchaeota archaeon]|nr:50S ribosomal protein L6 [Candidatus Micrarchaeota archaeon]
MVKKDVEKSWDILDGVNIKLENNQLIFSGPKGSVSKKIPPTLSVKIEQNKIIFRGKLALVNTFIAHSKNMAKGCLEGYTKKMKIVYAHFPISVNLKGQTLEIKNFLGERTPRYASIVGSAKVEIKGQEIYISGPSKEDVGQTVANISKAVKIKNYDPRVFQDGIYPVGE